ncbi:hypothetical protein CHS0354_019555 [Potamilus streckersoni]|uniref:Uncharacterized protein n=1 Tax=Potamilus streckersoni TaxID=2493646 RepID=A0AAE0TGH6_9BIVA|nr:hypothetical protein CHS0354_019555 [Potamilus streckersoni]
MTAKTAHWYGASWKTQSQYTKLVARNQVANTQSSGMEPDEKHTNTTTRAGENTKQIQQPVVRDQLANTIQWYGTSCKTKGKYKKTSGTEPVGKHKINIKSSGTEPADYHTIQWYGTSCKTQSKYKKTSGTEPAGKHKINIKSSGTEQARKHKVNIIRSLVRNPMANANPVRRDN